MILNKLPTNTVYQIAHGNYSTNHTKIGIDMKLIAALNSEERKRLLILVAIGTILFSLVFFFMFDRIYYGGWTCINNEWAADGKPITAKPDRPCPTPKQLPRTKEEMLKTFAFNVYFGKNDSACDEVYPVQRKIMNAIDTHLAVLEAMDELVKGPTETELELGFVNDVSEEEVQEEQFKIENDVVTVNTNQILRERNESFCKTSRKVKQVTETLKNLPLVKDVVVTQ